MSIIASTLLSSYVLCYAAKCCKSEFIFTINFVHLQGKY
jgi:hypothetical protein